MLKFIRARFILLAFLLGMTPLLSSAQVIITIAPPPLPVYDQPPCPEDGYLWSPGYWAYEEDDYYWVPGVWILAPEPGFLWTPGYWGFEGGNYLWHAGYWGPHIGFYGGVNYGFGYYGSGFFGGRWEGGRFLCNTAVWRVNNTVVHNTYVDRTVVRNVTNRVSFNGPGGIDAKETAEEQAARNERHLETTETQRTHEQTALHDNNQRFSVNKGTPNKTALSKVGGHEEIKGSENKAAGREEGKGNEGKVTGREVKGNENKVGGREEGKGNEGKVTGREEGKGNEGTPKEHKEHVTKSETQVHETTVEKHETKTEVGNKASAPGPEKVKPEGQNRERHEATNPGGEKPPKGEEKGKSEEKGKGDKEKKDQQH